MPGQMRWPWTSSRPRTCWKAPESSSPMRELAELVGRTEGWPVRLYLAAGPEGRLADNRIAERQSRNNME
jgi:hypothetical protein